tara:strand:- start:145 stop:324 length:180 start_codon:yes stop_codon:yes gene_type:complete
MRQLISISKNLIKIPPQVKSNKNINKRTLEVINLMKPELEKKSNQKINTTEVNILLLLP